MLNPARFNDMLCRLGQAVAWRRSYACPCIDVQTGQIQADCPHCAGFGRLWDDPIASMAGITGGKVLRRYETMAILDAGDVLMVLPSDQPVYTMGELDRVALTQRTEPFSMTVVPGVHARLRFAPASIERVFWFDDNQIVEGRIPDADSTGALTWHYGGAPPEGATYSITGRRHPEYYCYLLLPLDRPHARGQPLPRRALMRRIDLFWK